MLKQMLQENSGFESILRLFRRLIPTSILRAVLPIYHWKLATLGAIVYGFPSRKLKVIAVTGTKGKSTTTYMIARVLEEQGIAVAAIGSLGYKIHKREWPNTLKMTMPGRMKLQKFLREAVSAGCTHVVLETTSEGIAQHRLAGITIDCAVFTNIHPEHIESHGSFENYKSAKLKLFKKTKNIHVLNGDDPYFKEFRAMPAKQTYVFGMEKGAINQRERQIKLKLVGDFNIYNALAALDVAHAYALDELKAQRTLEAIESIPGRMEYIQREPFSVVVDYAHTPQSLELVYQALAQNSKHEIRNPNEARNPKGGKLICVLGSAGGGRDTWKRPKFGEIAAKYCDEIILTNEDAWDEMPEAIVDQIYGGISSMKNDEWRMTNVKKIMDRKVAIQTAIHDAQPGDTVVITGKGSETSMAFASGKKIPWSDAEIARETLQK